MQNTAASLVAASQSIKKLTALVLCLLFLTWAGWSGYERFLNPERPQGAIRTRTDIAARALRIATALNGSARLLAPPAFMKNPIHAGYGYSSRNAWVVLCEAGDQQVNMLFNDKSGRIVCLVMNYTAGNKSCNLLLPPVKTAPEAAAVAVERLKGLEALPHGAQIALEETPTKREWQCLWETRWRVKSSPTSVPYSVKLSLNTNTGLPTRMIDGNTEL